MSIYICILLVLLEFPHHQDPEWSHEEKEKDLECNVNIDILVLCHDKMC